MHKGFIALSFLILGLAVMLGAFGAHALEEILVQNNRVDTFETANLYHFIHGFAILIIGVLAKSEFKLNVPLINYLFLAGIILFSGSLYVLSLTGITKLGMITPIGGVCFIAAWFIAFYQVIKS